MTIPKLFQNSVERYKANIAFNYLDNEWRSITYHDLGIFAGNISSYLASETGIKRGDKVAIILENRPEWGIVYFGIVSIGAIAVPMDVRSTTEEIKNLINHSETVFVFFSEKTFSLIPEKIKGMSVDSDVFRDISHKKYSRSSEQEQQTVKGQSIEDSDIASIIYTSGTTGKPKGVMLSHGNLCSDALAAIEAGIVNESDNVLAILPLHHIYPFMCTLLVPVIIGASITYPPSLKGPELISTIKEKEVTVFVGVPQVLELIRDAVFKRLSEMPALISQPLMAFLHLCGFLRRRFDINAGRIVFRTIHKKMGPRFRFFTSGGARLDPLVFNDLEALGFTVLEGYGLSETSPIVTFNPIERRKPGSAGKPLPGVDIKVINPTESGEGEIAIRGPMVMRGYFKNPEETSRAIVDGWLRTGDLGYIDEEGYLFITGRVKEVIVLSSGKNVYPEDVEKQYLKSPLIKEICVFGLEERGQVASLHALVVPDLEYMKKARIANLRESLKWEINQISMKLPPHMRLRGFTIYTEPLSRTALGKLKRYLISEIYRSGKAERKKEDDPRIKTDEFSYKVANCLRSVIREDIAINLSDNLELDLGLDSLKRLELVVALENTFSLKLPESFASEVITVNDLITRLKNEVKREKISDATEIEKDLTRIGLYPKLIERFIVFFLLAIIKILVKFIFRLEVRGIKNLPDHPFIIAANHCSYLDGFVITASVPYSHFSRLFFQGFQRYFTGGLRPLFGRLAHVIPIDAETFLGRAMEISFILIQKGYSICIFPEGGRSFDGEIIEFKKGIGILAIKNNIPVIPVLIEGTFEALPRGAKMLKPSKVKVTFGRPVYPSDVDFSRKPVTIDEYQYFANRVREEIIRLKA